jgi:hypothetical protein
VRARAARAEAGREVLSATARLSDGLLVEERRCFAEIETRLGEFAVEVADMVRRSHRARTELWVNVDQVLPAANDLRDVVMPPIGDLLALTRERTLTVVRRQMKALGSTVPLSQVYLSAVGNGAARSQAPSLESAMYDQALAGYARAYLDTRLTMRAQAELWFGRDEPLDALVARWTAPGEVLLPGADTRGALWRLRPWMNAEARTASVSLTNALLLAAMGGWNDAASA